MVRAGDRCLATGLSQNAVRERKKLIKKRKFIYSYIKCIPSTCFTHTHAHALLAAADTDERTCSGSDDCL